MIRQIFLFLLSYMLSLAFVDGQRLNMKFYDPFKDLTLTNNNVTDVIQDSTGLIWIATKDGLNVFNGADIKKYVNDPFDSTSLVNNQVLSLFEDSSGRLWVATNLGLSLYDAYYDHFISLITESNYNGTLSPYIIKVVEDLEKNIYVASEFGLFKFDEVNTSFTPFLSYNNGQISEVLFDQENNIWISSFQGGGLYFYDRGTKELTSIRKFKGAEHFHSTEIRDISFYHGELWIATNGDGMYSFDINKGILKQYPVGSEYEKYAVFTYVDRDDRLWACDLTGLKLYDEDLDLFYGYYSEEGEKNNLKKNAAGIYQDRQGNYWSIHNPGGVSLRTVRRGIELYNTNPEWYWHTLEDNITAFNVDEIGNWWIGNQYNGIDIFEWQKGKITTLIHNPENPHSLGRGTVFKIFVDSHSEVWVGSHMGGCNILIQRTAPFFLMSTYQMM